MKLTDRLNLRLSPSELQDFERAWQAWKQKGQAQEHARNQFARIWSRSAFARELLAAEVQLLVALLPDPKT